MSLDADLMCRWTCDEMVLVVKVLRIPGRRENSPVDAII
jgi:hypothetical protein